MAIIPFCGQTYVDKTLRASAQDSINLYPMRTKMAQYSDKKISQSVPENIVMYPSPGYKWLNTAGSDPIRGFYVINTTLYLIRGNALLQFVPSGAPNDLTNGTFKVLGGLGTNTGLCSIVCNTVQLVISDGTAGYTYTFSTGIMSAIPTTGSFPAAGGCTNFTYFDSYVVGALNNSKTVIQSNVLDGQTWQSLAFDTIVSYSDNITAIFSDELQLYVGGPKIIEVQADAGQIPYAFEKVPNVLIQAGFVNWQSICKIGNTTMALFSDIAGKSYVGAFEGYATKVLSTPPINEAFERYAVVNDAFAYVYREGDNQFYVITFPSAGATWAYDTKMDMWHKRSINGGADLPTCCTLWQGLQIVGDASGNLYQMSQNYTTFSQYNNGVVTDYPMMRQRVAQHLNADGKTIFIHELWVDLQVGTGFITDSKLNVQPTATAPLATLEVSRDYGITWINVGSRSLGSQGGYQKRVLWRNLGRFRQNVTFRLTVTDPVQVFILGAKAVIKAGTK